MSGWLTRETRAPEWKRSWTQRTISSISPPPLPLLSIFAIVAFYLFLTAYFSYKEEVERTVIGFKIFLLFLPVILIILVRNLGAGEGRIKVRIPKPEHDSIHRVGSSPWGMAIVLLILLVLISYHSCFKSKWFRPLWYNH